MVEQSNQTGEIAKMVCVFIALKCHFIGFDNALAHFSHLSNEPRHGKTGFLHMRKQRRRSASR